MAILYNIYNKIATFAFPGCIRSIGEEELSSTAPTGYA
jgi:hypothetical protein